MPTRDASARVGDGGGAGSTGIGEGGPAGGMAGGSVIMLPDANAGASGAVGTATIDGGKPDEREDAEVFECQCEVTDQAHCDESHLLSCLAESERGPIGGMCAILPGGVPDGMAAWGTVVFDNEGKVIDGLEDFYLRGLSTYRWRCLTNQIVPYICTWQRGG